MRDNKTVQESRKDLSLVPVVQPCDPQMDWYALLIHPDKYADNAAFHNCLRVKDHDPVQYCEQQSDSGVHPLLAVQRVKIPQTSKSKAAKNKEMLPAHRQDVPNQECLLGFFQRFALSRLIHQ